MSSTVDQRIVEMQFNNQRFEENVSTSISTLDKLKSALNLEGASKGLDSVEKSFSKFDLSGIGSAVETISSRFSTLGIIGTTILQDIGHKAFEAGQQILGMVKSMTVSQIGAGWGKYAEKTTSVQTIMAATNKTWQDDANSVAQLNALLDSGFDSKNASTYLQTWKDVNQGIITTVDAAKQLGITTKEFSEATKDFGNLKGIEYQGSQMDYVNSQMEKLNWFSDETSYNFTDMVNNIGKFTANNIPLSQAATAMQGIANWAAISGQSAGTASRAMYNMAQAIGVGSVKLMDWKSIENANMATSEFKQKAIEMAVANGTLKESFDKTGKAIYKTASGMDVTVESFSQTLSSGWFNKNVLLDTLSQYGGFTDKLYEFSTASDLTATEVLDLIDAEKAGSITQAQYDKIVKDSGLTLEEVKAALADLGSKENAFGRATFKAAQEAKTFQDAIDATKDAASTKWMNIFENIFGDYEKAKQVWTGFANFLYDTLVAPLERLEGLSEVLGELNAVGRIARGFNYIFSFLKGDGIDTFGLFDSIAKGFQRVFPPIDNLKLAISTVLTAFTRWGKSIQLTREQFVALRSAANGLARIFKIGVLDSIINLWKATEPLRTSLSGLATALVNLFIKFGRAGNGMHMTALSGELLGSVCDKLASVIDKVSEALNNITIEEIRSKFNSFFGVIDKVRSAFDSFASQISSFSFESTFGGAIDWVQKKLAELQKFLSTFNIGKALLGGVGVGAGALLGAGILKIVKLIKNPLKAFDGIKEKIEGLLDSIGDAIGGSKITGAIDGLKKIASAILILAAALLVLGFVDYDNAIIGIGIIGTALAVFFANLKAFEKVKASSIAKLAGIMLAVSASMLVFSVALIALAGAIALFALVAKMDTVWLGLGVMAASLGVLVVAMWALSKVSPKVLIGAAALLAVSAALIVLAGAMALFALVAGMKNVWKGLGLMAASLGVLVVSLFALSKISPLMIVGAASIIGLSAALIVLAGAMALFAMVAGMENAWNGLALMAASLGVLVIALLALSSTALGALGAAAAILILSAALLVLSGVMAAFAAIAGMDTAWAGLGLLAAMLGALTLALLLLAPAALGVMGAAVALLLVAGACLVLAAAIGVVGLALPLLGSGLQALAEGVSAGLAALGVGIFAFGEGVAALIESIASGIAEGIGALGEGIGTAISSIAEGVSSGLTSLGEGISGFGAGVGDLITTVMASVSSGVEGLVSSIGKGIASGIDAISGSITNFSAGLSDVGTGITDFGNGIRSLEGINWVATGAGIATLASDLKKLKVDDLSTKIAPATEAVIAACTTMVEGVASALDESLELMQTGGVQMVDKVASGISSRTGIASSAGSSVGQAIVNGLSIASASARSIGSNAGLGFVNGFLSKELTAGLAGRRIARAALEAAKKELDSHSPSREFFKIGNYGTQGFINGLLAMSNSVEDAGVSISDAALATVSNAMANVMEMMDDNPEYYPTIRPVLDSSSVEAGLYNLSSIGMSPEMSAKLTASQDLSEIQNGRKLLTNALANVDLNQKQRELDQFTAKNMEDIMAIGTAILSHLEAGHDLYFDDGAFAGRINRRLGSI